MSQGVVWFHDFLGIGYRPKDPYTVLLLIFKNRSEASKLWHEVLRWWMDDEIKIRFVEVGNKYQFIMYCETHILKDTWVCLKTLNVSEHYKKFRDSYKDRAFLGLAVYREKKDTYNLHILKNTKNIVDVEFIKESEVEEGSVVWRAREVLYMGL